MTRGVPVEVDGVSRRFGRTVALDSVSFELRPGEVVGLLGPNGAGKSTTMRILAGYLRAGSGRVVIGGIDNRVDAVGARRLLGYLPESVGPSKELSVNAFVAYAASLRGLRGGDRRRAVGAALRQAGLDTVAGERVATLSKGYRQRVGLAQALVHDPPVLVLDEPTSGLDPAQVTETRNLIARLGRQRTVLLSSHLLAEVSALCRRVLVIDHGRLVADSDVASLTRAAGERRLEVRVDGAVAAAADVLRGIDGVTGVELRPDRVVVRGRGGDLERLVSAAVVTAGLGLIELRAEDESLEDAYLRLVRP